jgi:SM-20-related protein
MNSKRNKELRSRRNQILQKLGVFGRNHAIPEALCTHYFQLMRDARAAPAEILRTDTTTLVDQTVRKTISVDLPPESEQPIRDILVDLMPELSAHFEVPLQKYEEPQFLRYGPGAFFTAHRDRPNSAHLETSDRKISLVIFLNDDFEGGELTFYGLIDQPAFANAGLPCDAAPGLAIAFRSETLHEVTPVTSGQRFTIVTWYS